MKKKILFVAQNFEVGGVQTALISLLNNLQKNHLAEYDIKLFCFGRGRFLSQVPENIDIKFGNFFLTLAATPFMEVLKSKNPIKIFVRMMLMIYVRIIGSEKFYRNQFEKHRYNEKFDAAISYFNDVPRNYFNQGTVLYVSDFVNADERVAWIHNDPIGMNFEKEHCAKAYRSYDRVICVSKGVKEKFDMFLPEYAHKTEVCYNKFSETLLRRRADEFEPFEKQDFDIVTVARIDNVQKRIDKIVGLCRRLKDDGVKNFKWRIVGGGPELSGNMKLAKEFKVRDVLEFCGEQENPYPYIKNSDLFALYSAYEGHPMVIGETKALGVYILTTPYAAACEQIGDKDGIIATDDEDFYLKLKELIQDGRKDGKKTEYYCTGV